MIMVITCFIFSPVSPTVLCVLITGEIHRYVLCLGEAVEHSRQRKLAPQAIPLVAAIGMARKLVGSPLDLHPARFDIAGGAKHFTDVVRPQIGGEPVMAIAGPDSPPLLSALSGQEATRRREHLVRQQVCPRDPSIALLR
jgi:hypothetical protein